MAEGRVQCPQHVPSPFTSETPIRMAPGCDIIEPCPSSRSGGVMRLWQWVLVWVWLARPGPKEAVPRPERAKASAPGAAGPLFVDRPDFFDYPDSDRDSLLAVAQLIGERPVVFVHSDSDSRLFHHILVGALVVAFFFLLFQFCTHMSCQKGA
ncbi:fertilization-influencing membrane protein isoform X2 [Oryctolagus cuniculus]|uniref:fertilization-influencing membrane protein isoform X2 n=1 Tax=Oryctolagus cuniculus TaxID=9986 RepID=UPI00387979AB